MISLSCENGLWFQGEKGMKWSNLNDEENGMKEVLIILFIEWIVFLILTIYLDQVVSDNGIRKHPLFFLGFKRKGDTQTKGAGPALTPNRSRKFSGSRRSLAHINAEDLKNKADRPDVAREVSHEICPDENVGWGGWGSLYNHCEHMEIFS